jgi:hypothetical protein
MKDYAHSTSGVNNDVFLFYYQCTRSHNWFTKSLVHFMSYQNVASVMIMVHSILILELDHELYIILKTTHPFTSRLQCITQNHTAALACPRTDMHPLQDLVKQASTKRTFLHIYHFLSPKKCLNTYPKTLPLTLSLTFPVLVPLIYGKQTLIPPQKWQ